MKKTILLHYLFTKLVFVTLTVCTRWVPLTFLVFSLSASQSYIATMLLLLLLKLLQSCPTLCDPIDGSPPGSPVPGILQARTLEWVAISFSNACKWKVKVKSLGRVRLFSDPMDCSPPGSSVHGVFQARVLEWGAIAFSHIATIATLYFLWHNSATQKEYNFVKPCFRFLLLFQSLASPEKS